MDWAKEILDAIDGKKKIPPHVLALIRPSVALLDLHLPIDVLYEHYRWSIRDLLRRVHPDARNGEVLNALKPLSDAFDFVKDKEVFAEVLARARDDRSYERLGERSLRERIQGLQEDVATLKAQMRQRELVSEEEVARITRESRIDVQVMKDLMEKREAFFHGMESKIRFGEWFHSYLTGQMMRSSSRSSNIRPIGGYMRLIVASFIFTFSTAHNAVSVTDLCERALMSGFATPSIVRGSQRGKRKSGAPDSNGPRQVIAEMQVEGWTKTMGDNYRNALESLARGLKDLYATRAIVVPQKITLESHIFNGDDISQTRLYMLGTVDPTVGLAHHQIPEHTAPRLQVADAVLPEVEPFVCPGRALVGIRGIESSPISPLFGRSEWDWLMYRKKGIAETKNTLFFSHIVLDVE